MPENKDTNIQAAQNLAFISNNHTEDCVLCNGEFICPTFNGLLADYEKYSAAINTERNIKINFSEAEIITIAEALFCKIRTSNEELREHREHSCQYCFDGNYSSEGEILITEAQNALRLEHRILEAQGGEK